MKSYSDEISMYYGAMPFVFKKAKELRKNQTPAESTLWEYLKDSRLCGLKFRRQHPISRYIADFYCHQLKLVIEIDGSIHQLPENKEHDIGRTTELSEFGIEVLRFTNDEVIHNVNSVLSQISNFVQQKYPHKVLKFNDIKQS